MGVRSDSAAHKENVDTVRTVGPPNEVVLALKRHVSNALGNWDLQRPYTASLAVRVEGFTEEWGNDDTDTVEPSLVSTDTDSFHTKPRVALSACHAPECAVRLVQYRPAWWEQLVLRIGKVPHVVLNSPYAVVEATGPLPYLQVLGGPPSVSALERTNAPAMVGRTSLSIDLTSAREHGSNAILDYLKQFQNLDLDQNLTPLQRQQSVLYTSLIQETLQPCLTVLRYLDVDAWDQIYRPQCLAALAGRVHSNGLRQSVGWASWHAWSERVHAISLLTRAQRQWSVPTAVQVVRQAYAVLEAQLQQSTYLLGATTTTTPSMVDCLLWDHLLQALSDIHLVVVLADFPALLRFTQHIWNTFQFSSGVDNCATHSPSLTVWNLEENMSNAFNQMPLSRGIDTHHGRYQSALDLMQQLALVHGNLHDTLVLTQPHRAAHTVPQRRPWATWHRWRMGGGYYASSDTARQPVTTGASSPEELVRREYQRNDEIWMASVAAATLALFLSFGLAGVES